MNMNIKLQILLINKTTVSRIFKILIFSVLKKKLNAF